MSSNGEIEGGNRDVDVALVEGEIIKRLDRTTGALGFAALYADFSDAFDLPVTKAANLTWAALGGLNKLGLVEVDEASRTVSLILSEPTKA